ncbi:MAG: AI-2E family transporter [Cyanobacteria bacterium P01_E01_bin.6]
MLEPERRISISLTTLLLVPALIVIVLVVWQLRGLIVLLMMSLLLASAIAPIVDTAERWHIPRWLTVILVYLGLIGGLTGVGLLIGPTVFEQLQRLIRQVPISLTNLLNATEAWVMTQSNTRPELVNQLFDQIVDAQGLTTWAIRSTQKLLIRSVGLTTEIAGGVFSVVLALFLSGYFLSDSRTLTKSATRLFPKPWDERLAEQVGPISHRIGSYIRGRILVSAILAAATTTSLSVLGLADFALGLGAIAGVTNLIPFLGPVLGAIPALVVAISQGWWTFLWVLLLFAIIQNVETYILDPLLVGSSVGIHPLYQLLAVLGGTQVLGILGAIIVPPWVAGASVVLDNLYLQPKLLAERQGTVAVSVSDQVSTIQ